MSRRDDGASDDPLTQMVIAPSIKFFRDSQMLVRRCAKPDKKEFKKITLATATGFLIMGFIGFFVKLIFIPLNNIIVGSFKKLDLTADGDGYDLEGGRISLFESGGF